MGASGGVDTSHVRVVVSSVVPGKTKAALDA